MTDSTPVGRISSMLESAGYRRVADPLRVGSLSFEFPAALVPSHGSSELVVVADSAYDDDTRLLLKVEGVARALDISRSTRSLTLIVTGPRPATSTLESLSRVCRVLPTGTVVSDSAEATLHNWLAVLLPLALPEAEALTANPLAQIQAAATRLDPAVQQLVELARQGQAAVQAALYHAIDTAVSSAEGKKA